MADNKILSLLDLGKHVGRRGLQKMGLLDDADNNIGNAVAVPPFANNQGFATVKLPDNPRGERILFLDGLSRKGNVVTVGVAAQSILKPLSAGPQSLPAVVTATIEYGNGSQVSFIEVDIPVGRVSFSGGQLTNVEDGAMIVTLPAGTLRVWGRNDSNYIVPDLSGLVGDANLNNLVAPVDTGDADDALVKAFVTYNTLRQSPSNGSPTRTYVIGRGQFGAVTAINFTNDPPRAYLVPPLAKRFKILRWNGTGVGDMPLFSGTVYDADNNGLYNFATAVDVVDQYKELPGVAHSVGIALLGIDRPNGYAAIVWEIGV